MDVDKIKSVFFEAMKMGYAFSDSPRLRLNGLPGSKSIPFQRENYTVLDYYFTSPNSTSGYGSTIIWESGNPVWMIHYGGWYEKKVITFLKRALLDNYVRNIFLGGRGPEIFEMGEVPKLRYTNKFEGNFEQFHGYENIVTVAPQFEGDAIFQGEHWYFGGLFRNNSLASTMYGVGGVDDRNPVLCDSCEEMVILIAEEKQEKIQNLTYTSSHKCPQCGQNGILVKVNGIPTLKHPHDFY